MVLVFEMTDPLRDALVKAREMARRELVHIEEDVRHSDRIAALHETRQSLSRCIDALGCAGTVPCYHKSIEYNVFLYGTPELATYGDRCQKCDKVVRINN